MNSLCNRFAGRSVDQLGALSIVVVILAQLNYAIAPRIRVLYRL